MQRLNCRLLALPRFPRGALAGLAALALSAAGPRALAATITLLPPAPTGLTATAPPATGDGLAQIDLSWSGNGTETTFEIQRAPTGGNWIPLAVVPGQTVSLTDLILPGGPAFSYRVRGISPAGASEWSETASAQAPLLPPVTFGGPALEFAPGPVGSFSAPRAVTYANTGAGTLLIRGVTIGGADAADFSVTAGDTTLAPGAAATLTLRFSPTGVGSRRALLTVADNLPGSPHTLALTGTGLPSPGYSILDIGTLGGTTSEAVAINNAGQMAGNSSLAGDQISHAYLYSGGVMHDLGTLGGNSSTAVGLDEAGEVAGYSTLANGSPHAFLYSGGVMHDLGTLGGRTSGAAAISRSGVVVGEAETADGATHVFRYQNGTMEDLGALGTWVRVYGVNNAGQIVGYVTAGDPSVTPGYSFLYSDGALHILDSTPGSQAWDINDAGQITGDSSRGAFFYQDGRVQQLGALGGSQVWPSGLNNASEVIGTAGVPGGDNHACLWRNGIVIDLNRGLPAGSGWQLIPGFGGVSAINDAGQMSGGGRHNGQNHAFILTPDPEPALTAAPTELAAVAHPSTAGQPAQVTLSWNDSDTDTVFEIQRQDTGDWAPLTIAPAGSSSFNDTAVVPGIHYAYRVRALAPARASDWSNEATAVTASDRSPAVRLSPTTLDFGPEPVGLGTALGVLVQNNGSAPLAVSSITFQGANAGDFALATDGVSGHTIQPGDISLLNVRFSPTATGSRSATLVISDDAADSPQSLALTGTGTAPLLQLSAASLLFGLQSSSTQSVTLTNNGDAPLLIDALTMAGPDAGRFKIVSDTGETSLDVGGSRIVQIAFQAATVAGAPRHGMAHIAAASYTATLEIKDNDPHSTSLHSVALIASSSVGAGGDITTPPPSGSAPAAPSGLTVQVRAATEVDLTWTDNSSNEDAFAVWRQEGSGDWTRVGVVIPNRAHFEDRTVSPGHSYTYRVRATTGHFASDWTPTVTATTPPVPATPTALTATVTPGPQVQLTWSNPQPDARLYLTVWRQDASGPWTRVALLRGDTTTFTDSTVAVNGSYSYQVHLVDGAAGSPWSNLAHASTGNMELARPSELTATVGRGPQVRLNWSLPAPNPHAYLTLWRQAAGGEWTRVALLRGDARQFTDTTVQPGTSYTYHAHLVTDAAVSAWSNTAMVSTPTAGPAQLSATAGPGAQVTLTWSNPHPDGRAWVTVWRQAGSGEWTRVALLHGDAASFTDTQVTAGASYRYRAHRVEGADVSDWSNEATAVLP